MYYIQNLITIIYNISSILHFKQGGIWELHLQIILPFEHAIRVARHLESESSAF